MELLTSIYPPPLRKSQPFQCPICYSSLKVVRDKLYLFDPTSNTWVKVLDQKKPKEKVKVVFT